MLSTYVLFYMYSHTVGVVIYILTHMQISDLSFKIFKIQIEVASPLIEEVVGFLAHGGHDDLELGVLHLDSFNLGVSEVRVALHRLKHLRDSTQTTRKSVELAENVHFRELELSLVW